MQPVLCDGFILDQMFGLMKVNLKLSKLWLDRCDCGWFTKVSILYCIERCVSFLLALDLLQESPDSTTQVND